MSTPTPTVTTQTGLLWSRRLGTATLLVLVAACHDKGITNPPTGGFTLAMSSQAISIARNASGTLTVTIARTGGFTGDVTLEAQGLRSTVTASFNPSRIASGQTSSTLTISPSATAPTGPITFQVQGSATDLANQRVDVQLTVTTPTQAGPFTLSITASSFLLLPPTFLFTSPIITITRNPGFTGPVVFTVTGLPASVFVGFSPSSTTGNSTTVLPLSLSPANGTYTATIHGTAAGLGEQAITLQLVVAPVSTGSIKWKFCSASLPRNFFAVRDGTTGPWTRIVPAADTSYSFNITQSIGSVAMAEIDSGGQRTTVYNYSAQEMAARAAAQCSLVANVTPRAARGSFGGVTGFRTSQVGMGWWFGSANGNGSFNLLNLPPGPLDIVAVRNAEIGQASEIPVDRMIIRRAQNPAAGATMPVFDFGATESFPPTVKTWAFGNVNGEPFGVSQLFNTAGGTTGPFTPIPAVDGTSSLRTVFGVPRGPTDQTIDGDLHQVIATVATLGPLPGSPARATRQIVTYSRGIADRALNFGPQMPAPNVTSVTALGQGRLRAQGTVPTEYSAGVSFDITQTTTARFATVHATRGFLGAGTTYDIQVPDLTAAIGWDTQFGLKPGVATNWWVNGGGPVLDLFDGRYLFNTTRSRWTGAVTGIVAPADGAIYLMARTVGATTP